MVGPSSGGNQNCRKKEENGWTESPRVEIPSLVLFVFFKETISCGRVRTLLKSFTDRLLKRSGAGGKRRLNGAEDCCGEAK